MEIVYAVLLSLAAIIGILLSISRKGAFQKIISFGLALSILITWTNDSFILSMSFLLLIILMAILTFVYGFNIKDINKLERFGICTIGLLYSLGTVFKIQHWPGAGIMKYIFIIPLVSYLTGLMIDINERKSINEIGFMVIWMSLLLYEIIKIWI